MANATIALLGAVFGSFANVAIHRWPRGGTVVTPPDSYCPSCEQPVAWYDNVPLLSWLVLRGRCRRCGDPIAIRYPAVELTMGLLWGVTAWVHGLSWLLLALLIFVWGLVVAAVIDLEHRIIPNRLTLPLPLVLLAPLVVDAATRGEWTDLRRGVVAGLAVPAGMFAVSELYRSLRGRSGIGMGDVKLAVSIGLVVGYLGGWHLLIFGYGSVIAAVLVAGGLLAAGRARLASRIPFGPYLALGALTAVLAGDQLGDILAGWLGV